ncbi:hypothetical protein PoB_007675900 [Plakobranchus ocellatus]|uniref:Uncharacterized protein n=1 Tax=Plakobranchus ocellatus TaxID=259542 RepID=A0AAV4E1U6_9GAST|nr:hypothetical protein PoB_007675900 [Plakobranchus ocellatus]
MRSESTRHCPLDAVSPRVPETTSSFIFHSLPTSISGNTKDNELQHATHDTTALFFWPSPKTKDVPQRPENTRRHIKARGGSGWVGENKHIIHCRLVR